MTENTDYTTIKIKLKKIKLTTVLFSGCCKIKQPTFTVHLLMCVSLGEFRRYKVQPLHLRVKTFLNQEVKLIVFVK